MIAPLSLDRSTPYRELRDPPLPDELKARLLECFAAQRATAAARVAGGVQNDARDTSAGAASDDAVSAARLESILASGRRVAGIASERDIATAIPFNVRNVSDVVSSTEVAAQRRRLDRELEGWIRSLFAPGAEPVVFPAGHWWYPPGTHLGWHTNERFPGWRLYLSHSESPGDSFFRYRDPQSGEIVTSLDGDWDLRLFEVATDRLLWHAIASHTHRYSIGWILHPWSLRAATSARVKRTIEALRG